MNSVERSVHPAIPPQIYPIQSRNRVPVDPLPLAMLSPATAIAPADGVAPELIVVSEPPPTRVLP
jgi:hypothetical protein